MNITTDRDGRIHFEQIWFTLEDFRSTLDDEQGLLFGQATFTTEMLLQELEVRSGRI